MGPNGSRKLEDLAFELDLVPRLRAGVSQRLLELLLRGRSARDAEAAVGAQDAEAPPRIRPRPVDEEARQAFVVDRRRLGRRGELEERAAEAFDSLSGHRRQRIDAPDALIGRVEARRLREEVELVEHDHLRELAETGPVLFELVVDR